MHFSSLIGMEEERKRTQRSAGEIPDSYLGFREVACSP